MQNKLVKKCSCCETQFSTISLPVISAEYFNEIKTLMNKAKKAMKLKGKLELMVTNELIAYFYYEYANKEEINKAREICERLYMVIAHFNENNSKNKLEWKYEAVA
jgi:hypothetical protein